MTRQARQRLLASKGTGWAKGRSPDGESLSMLRLRRPKAAPRCFVGAKGSSPLHHRRLGGWRDVRHGHPRSHLLDRRLAAAHARNACALHWDASELEHLCGNRLHQPPIHSIPPLVGQGDLSRTDQRIKKPVQCFSGQIDQRANFPSVHAQAARPTKEEHQALMGRERLHRAPNLFVSANQENEAFRIYPWVD